MTHLVTNDISIDFVVRLKESADYVFRTDPKHTCIVLVGAEPDLGWLRYVLRAHSKVANVKIAMLTTDVLSMVQDYVRDLEPGMHDIFLTGEAIARVQRDAPVLINNARWAQGYTGETFKKNLRWMSWGAIDWTRTNR